MIDSEDAEVWAAEIKKAWTKSREIRLQESKQCGTAMSQSTTGRSSAEIL